MIFVCKCRARLEKGESCCRRTSRLSTLLLPEAEHRISAYIRFRSEAHLLRNSAWEFEEDGCFRRTARGSSV
jgi:hypothetical protein